MKPTPRTPDEEFLAFQEALAGRYSLERELGRGGMGVVYLAQDVGLDRPVALKLLPPAFAVQPLLRERFIREARTAAKLSHPHIVPIHLVDVVGDFVFFVMAFVEGETLGRRVRERGPVHAREACRILREVSWALAYAHAQGVVHRDVKPDNILLEAGSGRALVTDFGIAHAGEAAGLTSVGEILGTPEYMSPEQARGEAVDARSDLYALGAVAHYMLSGKLPLQGANAQATLAKQLTQPAPALAAVAPEVPGALADAVDRCLAKDPAERFQGGEELADALGRVLQDRKEVPAAIRVFQEQNREATPVLVLALMVFIMATTIMIVLAEEGAGPELGEILLVLGASAGWLLVPLGMLGITARRLLKAGYDRDEMVRALRRDVEDRRRELASEAGTGDTAIDRWSRRTAGWGLAVFGASIPAIMFPAVPEWLLEPLLIGSMVVATGGGIVAAARHSLGRAVSGERWLRFWESPAGKGLFGAFGLGAGRAALASGGSYRPTELAIGMAAERLYEELPKDVRSALGDVPAVVKALEAHAESMRERIRDLDRVHREVGEGEATDPGRGALAIAGVSERRGSVADEVRRARDAAERRLREVVAALESLRLELLRLHAGSGSVETMTADLTSARALSEDMELLLEGREDVARMLGEVVEVEEPETPLPV